MTVEMASRVAKVKEEVEDTKPEFLAHPLPHPHPHPAHSHAPPKLQEEGGLGQDPAPVRIKEEGGLVDNTCHGCGQIITDQRLLKVTTMFPLKSEYQSIRWLPCCVLGSINFASLIMSVSSQSQNFLLQYMKRKNANVGSHH